MTEYNKLHRDNKYFTTNYSYEYMCVDVYECIRFLNNFDIIRTSTTHQIRLFTSYSNNKQIIKYFLYDCDDRLYYWNIYECPLTIYDEDD